MLVSSLFYIIQSKMFIFFVQINISLESQVRFSLLTNIAGQLDFDPVIKQYLKWLLNRTTQLLQRIVYVPTDTMNIFKVVFIVRDNILVEFTLHAFLNTYLFLNLCTMS